jgi:hypothetical protein
MTQFQADATPSTRIIDGSSVIVTFSLSRMTFATT